MKRVFLSLFVIASLSACGMIGDRILPDYKITAEGPTKDTKIYFEDEYAGKGKATKIFDSARNYNKIYFYVPGCQVGSMDIQWQEDMPMGIFWYTGSTKFKGVFKLDKTYYKYDKPCMR